MSLATRRKALPQSRCMLPGSWWHTDWQISNFEVWLKLLQAAASWARHPLNSHFSEKKLYPQSRVAVSGTECRLGRPPPSSRTGKKGTTCYNKLDKSAMSLQSTNTETSSFVAPALLVSRFRHVYWPTSSTIIHNHPQSSCFWGQSNCTLMGGTVAAFTWQMWPCKTVNCFAHLARIWTNLMTQLRILCKSWNSDDMIMICDDAWSILKRSELPLTRLSRRPPWSLHQDLQSTPERLESFWIFWHLLASIYLFYFQFKAPGGFAHFLNLQISRNLQWITSCRHSENDMWAQQRRVNENHGPVNKPHITANHSKSWAPTDWISSSMSPFSSALRCWSIARAWPVLEKRL